MCGIVGLLVKNPSMRDQIGQLMMPMLAGMTERGPDSAGLAMFSAPVARGVKISLYAGVMNYDWAGLEKAFNAAVGEGKVTVNANHGTLTTTADPDQAVAWIRTNYPKMPVLSVGKSMNIYKDTGLPMDVAKRYGFEGFKGTHLVAHTRMATESAVTPAHAHPFTAGQDFALVHNGSLSNPNMIRRKLAKYGIGFETDNDTEAACRFLQWRLGEGDDLKTALQKGFDELDGFFTLLMGTEDELALVRDPFACKPAVVAETDDYVAISSEFRSLAKLPNIKNANIFEPMPEELYVWKI